MNLKISLILVPKFRKALKMSLFKGGCVKIGCLLINILNDMIIETYNFFLGQYKEYFYRAKMNKLWKKFSKGLIITPLTAEQNEEIKSYWFELTGKKVSTKWHQLFYALTGVYQKEWMPFEICRDIQETLSPSKTMSYFDDKNLYRYLLKDFVISKRYLECSNGVWSRILDGVAVSSSRHECCKLIQNLGPCVIKPSIGTDGGNGVRLLELKNGVDNRTGDSIEKIFDSYYPNFLVEDRIFECENLAKLNSDSCNTMRVHTWRNRKENQVEFLSSYMRIGKKGSIRDNMAQGGMGVEVFADGSLQKGISCYPYRIYDKTDSDVFLDGYIIEDFKKIKETAIKAHMNLPMFDLCGWDIGVDNVGNVIIIEFNPNPDMRIEQLIFGTSCYKKQTDKVCKQVFSK